MFLQTFFICFLLALTAGQEKSASSENKNESPEKTESAEAAPPQQNDGFQQPIQQRQIYTGQQLLPDLYGFGYLGGGQQFPQGAVPRLQSQVVFYGPGGQGQPILINPGNPPGNFLYPQGPGPNVILRNDPRVPQGPVFPVAGYPKPAHIPPIEKDAEEIPTNPKQVPPHQSGANPKTNKPEKLETFNEPNFPEPQAGFPQGTPESVSLRPGQRFFVLNGDQIYSYPFEAQIDQQQNNEYPSLRYTQVQPFPQNPPPLAQEPNQFIQENGGPVPVPALLLRNSVASSQEANKPLKSAQQYFRSPLSANQPAFFVGPQDYPYQTAPFTKNLQESDGPVQPQVVGQFRFTPEGFPGAYAYKDDPENDAVVVEASFDNFDGRLNAPAQGQEGGESSSSSAQQPNQEVEPSMAQAGPQATAIAGRGGVAGAGPRGTAIVGKGGVAVSSPSATAVAGTKDEAEEEQKKKKPVKKNSS